jgi:hypothetical protein
MSDLNPVIAQALYTLKRSYGAPVDIYVQGAITTDTTTGSRAVAKTVYPIDVAIVLPAKLSRNDKRSISLISSNKAMVQGGFYDTTTRRFIIDRSDVPDLDKLTENDWLVFKGRKYQFESIQEFEDDAAWVITGKAVIGERPAQIFLVSADNLLSLNDVAAGGP